MLAQAAMFSIARRQVKKMRCPRLPATKKPQAVKPGTVTFLASEAASYITGEIVFVDGGLMTLNYTVAV